MSAATDAALLRQNVQRLDAFMNDGPGEVVTLKDGTQIEPLLGLIGSVAADTPPPVTWPGRHWYDTSDPENPVLNVRDADNAAWIEAPIDVFSAARRAEISAAAASDSADSASASATSLLLGLADAVYATKAAAEAAVGGLSNGDTVAVLVDESMANELTLYLVDTGALVFQVRLGSQTLASITKRLNFAGHARNTFNTLSLWSDGYLGTSGVGGIDILPKAITASQTGPTVTASSAVFNKLYVGTIIRWDSGEEAVLTAVDNSGSGWADITTCTVDRSQTVASGAATIRAKHLVGITYGDSVGNRINGVLQKLLWRSLGFGGYVMNPQMDSNSGGQVALATLSGGASDATADAHFGNFPWGMKWDVPSGGSIQFELFRQVQSGSARTMRHGLEPEERKYDTAILVWRRAAGAFTVERKRYHDAEWESVATVADASAGSGHFAYARYTHELRSDWQYRVNSTGGTTIEVANLAVLNNTAPGYVHWPLARGGEKIEDFDQMASSKLAELCQLFGQPDFRVVWAYDQELADTDPEDYTEIEDDRTLWAAAAPTCDHVWLSCPEPVGGGAPTAAWNEAVLRTALAHDDSFINLHDLFGDGATSASVIGWLMDATHPSIKAEVIVTHQILGALGIADHPTIREGRDVHARRGDFASLYLLGRNAGTRLREAELRPVARDRGLKWTNQLTLVGSVAAAIGTNDFTLSLHLTVPPIGANLARVSSDVRGTVTNGQLLVDVVGSNRLDIALRDGAGAVFTYRYGRFTDVHQGRTGVLTIRSDVANERFDVFWNGAAALGLEGTINGAGSPLGTWSGTGTEFGIGQASSLAGGADIFHAMWWPSRLTDEQIARVAETDSPAGTSPDFWFDFSAGIGRAVRDRTSNARDALLFRVSPVDYAIDPATVQWAYPRRKVLGPRWATDRDKSFTLMPGDDVIALFTATTSMTLPAAPAVGDIVKVTKATGSTVRIAQPALHQIKSGASATTIGTGGRIEFGGNADSVTLVCTRAEAGVAYEWTIVEQAGAALIWT